MSLLGERLSAAPSSGGEPIYWPAYAGHLAGWRSESFDQDIVPCAYDIVIDNDRRARLRIDRASSAASGFIGELKVVTTQAAGADGELPAQSISRQSCLLAMDERRRDDSANFVYDLHDGAHQYRVSDASDANPDPAFIQVPQVIAPPGVRKQSTAWQVNGETSSLDETLFDYLSR